MPTDIITITAPAIVPPTWHLHDPIFMPTHLTALLQQPGHRLLAMASPAQSPHAHLLVRLIPGETVDILSLFTQPAHRRHGYAQQLLQALESQARHHRCHAIMFEVRQSNTAALNLYSVCGFTPLGHRRNYYQNPSEDAVILTKQLI